ncbi:MAG: hypothetical protein GY777_32665 [Candidatus Brocadiaceae bacterium]|nr:hypothetical protein [Candidatus Brocadiaceae bacterium]
MAQIIDLALELNMVFLASFMLAGAFKKLPEKVQSNFGSMQVLPTWVITLGAVLVIIYAVKNIVTMVI